MSESTEEWSEIVVECPKPGCSWSTDLYGGEMMKLRAQVDAEIHWRDEHGGKIPDGADFGGQQCPECFDIRGLDGTASCSECGHIPEQVRDS